MTGAAWVGGQALVGYAGVQEEGRGLYAMYATLQDLLLFLAIPEKSRNHIDSRYVLCCIHG